MMLDWTDHRGGTSRQGMAMRHETWECGGCGEVTGVRHWLQRGGVIVHDPEAAFREAAGLDEPEPDPPGTNRSKGGER